MGSLEKHGGIHSTCIVNGGHFLLGIFAWLAVVKITRCFPGCDCCVLPTLEANVSSRLRVDVLTQSLTCQIILVCSLMEVIV